MTLSNITAGFRVTVVYPMNRNAFVLPEEECHNHTDSSLAASNGLNYIVLPVNILNQSCTTPEVDQSQDPESTQLQLTVSNSEFGICRKKLNCFLERL